MDDQLSPSPPPPELTVEPQPPGTLPAAAVPTLGHRIFIRSDGLRPIWSILLYLAIAAAISTLLLAATRFLQPHGLNKLWIMLIGETELLVGIVAAAFIMARIEKRPFGDYGLPRVAGVAAGLRPAEDGASPVSTRALFGRQFWAGVVWGLVALTLLIVAMRAAGAFYFGGLELHGTRILKFAAFWGVFFIVVGLFEEFLFRGYTQFTVSRGIGFWPAALLLSCIFGGIHLGNKGEAWIGALAAGLIGLFFCLTLRRTGNLWFAVGFHASWDWGETYLYGVPNSGIEMPGQLLNSSLQGSHWLSGGSVGPEGSIFAFILIGLLWVVFDRMYPAANYPR